MEKLKYKTERVIKESKFSKYVREFYGKSYQLQQQEFNANGSSIYIEVAKCEDEEYFSQDPNNMYPEGKTYWKDWITENFELTEYSEREHFPALDMVTTDLCNKGLLDEGDYRISVSW